MVELGRFFKEKFGKDPKELTLKEIDAIAIKKGGKGYRSSRRIVITRGSVFRGKFYNISRLFDEAIKR